MTIMGALLVSSVSSADILSDSGASFSAIQGSSLKAEIGYSYDPSRLQTDFFWTKNCLDDILPEFDMKAPVTIITHMSSEMAF